ncbi:MAG: GNAT family N-acetyltransferase [Dehalococcoidia bacterium]|nr:GNAT family N-acetyltransferase [Dehalococcoidia bacterium]
MANVTGLESRVRVRGMTEEDVESVLEIERRVRGSNRAVTYAPAPESSIGGEIEHSVVAEENGRVVGFILGRKVHSPAEAGEIAWIDFVGLLPDYQHKGIGRRMAEGWKELCRQKGIKKAHIMISRRDSWLQAFFESAGFSQGDLIDYETEIQ